jgi:hypothetical protein
MEVTVGSGINTGERYLPSKVWFDLIGLLFFFCFCMTLEGMMLQALVPPAPSSSGSFSPL